jgi:uncharacterized CHY-type Zn-finger protein
VYGGGGFPIKMCQTLQYSGSRFESRLGDEQSLRLSNFAQYHPAKFRCHLKVGHNRARSWERTSLSNRKLVRRKCRNIIYPYRYKFVITMSYFFPNLQYVCWGRKYHEVLYMFKKK